MFSINGLRAKLIGLNLALVGFLTMAAGVLAYTAVTEEKQLLEKVFEDKVQSIGDDIQDQFFERYGDVKAFAVALGAAYTENTDTKKLSYLLDNYVSLYGIYDLIVFTGLDGKPLATNTIDPSGKTIDTSSIFANHLNKTNWFQNVSRGNFTEDTQKGFTGVYVEQPHFEPILENIYKKPWFGNSFSTEVKTAQGKLIGYLSAQAEMRWVEAAMKRSYLDLKKKNFVTTGFLMYTKDGSLIVDYVPEQNNHSLEFSHDKSKLGGALLTLHPEFAEAKMAPGAKGQGNYSEATTGHSRNAFFAPIKGEKIIDNFWNVAITFDKDEAFAQVDALLRTFIILMLVSSLIALGMGFWFGDHLSKKLSQLVARLKEQGLEVKEASVQVSSTSSQLSASASQQAAALQETVAAVNEISAMVTRAADMAAQSQQKSQSSSQVANEGKRTVEDMLHSMNEIKGSNSEIMNQVEESNQQISQIVKVIGEIGNKTKVINDIVFQTKLLSFNASVEAARAGEHGKGFAVVAEEVGNLAQMSGTAAKEISELLEQSVDKVQGIVDQTGQKVSKLIVSARERVANGEETAHRCAQILEQILLNAEEVNSMIGEITTSAQEQARGVQEINSAMNELDSVTQQNSSSAAQASGLAAALLSQSEELSKLVLQLNQVVSGNKNLNISEDSSHSASWHNSNRPLAATQNQSNKNLSSHKNTTQQSIRGTYKLPPARRAGHFGCKRCESWNNLLFSDCFFYA